MGRSTEQMSPKFVRISKNVRRIRFRAQKYAFMSQNCHSHDSEEEPSGAAQGDETDDEYE